MFENTYKTQIILQLFCLDYYSIAFYLDILICTTIFVYDVTNWIDFLIDIDDALSECEYENGTHINSWVKWRHLHGILCYPSRNFNLPMTC